MAQHHESMKLNGSNREGGAKAARKISKKSGSERKQAQLKRRAMAAMALKSGGKRRRKRRNVVGSMRVSVSVIAKMASSENKQRKNGGSGGVE